MIHDQPACGEEEWIEAGGGGKDEGRVGRRKGRREGKKEREERERTREERRVRQG